jgi:hypothetical protein
MLDVVSGARPIAAAVRRLRQRLAGLTVRNVSISWHGGGAVRGDIVWRRDERFWWRHDGTRPGRHSLMFGYAPDPPAHSQSATCEINLPAAGADRRLAGALVRDAAGGLYLAHSGKIGGGRRGRHREAFRAFLAGGNWQAARWPDGQAGDLLLIAPLDGPRLARQIGRFVQAVHGYKRQEDAAAPMPAALVAACGVDNAKAATRHGFADGAAAPWPAGSPALALAALCDRGLLLDALAEQMARRGLIGDGVDGDPLFAARGPAARLIELETDASNAALERAIGRLLLRVTAAGDSARAILVVPEAPTTAALAALSRHGVILVRYRWQGARPLFVGLDAALG